jgi:dihydropteroate synthase
MNVRIININDVAEAKKAIALTGADSYSYGLMAPKAVFKRILVGNVDNRAAALIKQNMLSVGGEAAVSEKVSRFEKGVSKLLLMGTLRQYDVLIKKLSSQPFGLKKIAIDISAVLSNSDKKEFLVKAGRFKLKLGLEPLVMGILNVTTDSFYDGGKYSGLKAALERGLEIEAEGAGIIDIGGESSRPGAKPLSEKEEIARVVPIIKELAKKVEVPVSIDTYKPAVAKAALEAGASIVNDITALGFGGGRMAALVVKHKAAVILMHMQGRPGTMQKNPKYSDVTGEISDFFEKRIGLAVKYGIKSEQIMIDPGIGFGKTYEHNLEILKKLSEFKALGFPIVAGVSRKSFIGKALGSAPVSDRLFGSISSGVWAALNGANVLRVHDVKETVEALKVLQCIADSGKK